MRVLLTGAAGQVGSALLASVPPQTELQGGSGQQWQRRWRHEIAQGQTAAGNERQRHKRRGQVPCSNGHAAQQRIP